MSEPTIGPMMDTPDFEGERAFLRHENYVLQRRNEGLERVAVAALNVLKARHPQKRPRVDGLGEKFYTVAAPYIYGLSATLSDLARDNAALSDLDKEDV